MARDPGLEEVLEDELAPLADRGGLVAKRMFGGLCWLWRGNLLCCASDRGILFRLGRDHDPALLGLGVEPMVMGGRPMPGWVRLASDLAGDDALRQRLLAAAAGFVEGLPEK